MIDKLRANQMRESSRAHPRLLDPVSYTHLDVYKRQRYQMLNLAGGALVLVNSFYHGAMPSVAVNVFWIGIALFALSRVWLARH